MTGGLMNQYAIARRIASVLQCLSVIGFVFGAIMYVLEIIVLITSPRGHGSDNQLGFMAAIFAACAIQYLMATAVIALFDISDHLKPRKKRRREPLIANSDSVTESPVNETNTSPIAPEEPVEIEPETPEPLPEPVKREPVYIPDMDPSIAQQIADEEMQQFKSKIK
jgi:hypothetical protein